MDSKRIIIIGCCGSGKSTLARQINQKMDIPIVHLDQLFWRSNWQHISDDEFDRLLQDELKKDNWIIDGNYNHSLQKRFEYADTVIYLDYSRIICIWGIVKRVIKNHGRTRPDMSENCPEKFDFEFLKYTWNFNKKYHSSNMEIIKNCDNKTIYIFKNRRQCNQFLESI